MQRFGLSLADAEVAEVRRDGPSWRLRLSAAPVQRWQEGRWLDGHLGPVLLRCDAVDGPDAADRLPRLWGRLREATLLDAQGQRLRWLPLPGAWRGPLRLALQDGQAALRLPAAGRLAHEAVLVLGRFREKGVQFGGERREEPDVRPELALHAADDRLDLREGGRAPGRGFVQADGRFRATSGVEPWHGAMETSPRPAIPVSSRYTWLGVSDQNSPMRSWATRRRASAALVQ